MMVANNDREKIINICFISDDDYVTPTTTAISSLCIHSDESFIYNVYVIMPENSSEIAKNYFVDCAVKYENVNVCVIEKCFDDLMNLHQYNDQRYLAATTTALFKFKLANIFSNLDKILYLDGDIIIRDSLTELYEYDIKDYYVAAVRDLPQVLYREQPIGKEISGIDYFNSGVMLLNLKKMRENEIEAKLIETKKNYTDSSLMDQNIFNIVFKDSVLQLPFIYNTCYINLIESKDRYSISKINEMYSTNYETVYEILKDIKIMHFSSKLKPWYFYDVPLADEWLYYYNRSSLRNVKIQRIYHISRNVDMESVKNSVRELSAFKHKGFKRLIPIVFAGNEKYLQFAAVSIQSIYENSNPEYLYDINIFVDASLSENMKRRLNSLKYPNLRIMLWDVRNSFNGIDLYSVGHYSKQMYYRWLIPEILSMYNKVIYLDCDLVVNRDIADLYVAAVNNFLRDNLVNHVENRLGLGLNNYFNSGVLKFNCKAWINANLKNKCIACLKSYNKLPCPDQDVLNLVCKGRIYKLNDTWNFQWHHQFKDARKGKFVCDYDKRFNNLLLTKPSIIHFTSFLKPWEHPERAFSEYFWNYCRNSDFYEMILFANIQNADLNKKRTESGESVKLRNKLNKLKHSYTYKIACFINFIPRKIKGYNFAEIPPVGCGQKELKKCINSIYNSRSFKIANKITAIFRKIKSKIK